MAADRVLDNLFPNQASLFDSRLQNFLAQLPGGHSPGIKDGIAFGGAVAEAILAWRASDGSDQTIPYTPGTQPGQWQPTPPTFSPALFPQWSQVTPFAMTGGSQFRPSGPPELASPAYAAALKQVESLGSVHSETRTGNQTQIALFWADGAGTASPPGHWNEIAEQIAAAHRDTVDQDARLFAMVNITLADAAIAAWDAKYTYNFWRPVTAIQNANLDGNSQTTADPTWAPLLVTPAFPSYVSGHSTFSAAAAVVLTSFFGDDVPFTATSDALPGVKRSFHSFMDAAEEAGLSRIYGGIHYSFDNRDGLALGGSLADYVVHNLLLTRDKSSGEGEPNRGDTNSNRESNTDRDVFLERLLVAFARGFLSGNQLSSAEGHHGPDQANESRDGMKFPFYGDLARDWEGQGIQLTRPQQENSDHRHQAGNLHHLIEADAEAFVEGLRSSSIGVALEL